MQTSKLFVSFLFCFVLSLMSGCGGNNASKLTSAEQTEADKIIAEHGKHAIGSYLEAVIQKKGEQMSPEDDMFERMFSDTEEETILKYLKYLVPKGADVNAKEQDHYPPINLALMTGNIEIAEFLISNGADVNTKDVNGKTLLHVLINQGGNIEIIKFLVSKGADVNAKVDNYGTPLDTAMFFEEMHGKEMKPGMARAVVEYLKSVGAKSGEDL